MAAPPTSIEVSTLVEFQPWAPLSHCPIPLFPHPSDLTTHAALRTIRLGRGPLAHASGAVMPQAGAADAGPLLALPAPEAAAAGQDVEDEDVFFTEEDIGGATEAAEEAGLGSGGAEEPEGPVETDQGLTEAIPEEGAPAGTAASTTPGSTEVSHTPAGPIVSAAAANATASEAPGGLTQPDLPAGMAPPKAPAGMAPPQAPAGMAPARAPPGMAPPRLPTGMDAPELPTAMAPTRVPPGMAPPTLPAGLAPPVRPAGQPAQAAIVAGDGSRPLDGATPPGAEILRQGLEMPGAAGKETARVALEAFEGLLRALGIHAFSRWEKEVPRMQADPRYKASKDAMSGWSHACFVRTRGCLGQHACVWCRSFHRMQMRATRATVPLA